MPQPRDAESAGLPFGRSVANLDSNKHKNCGYPGAASVGGGVGRPIRPTMRRQMFSSSDYATRQARIFRSASHRKSVSTPFQVNLSKCGYVR